MDTMTVSEGRAMTQSLEVLYEDNHCLAVFKPPGRLSTHFEGREETLDRAVKAYLKKKYDKPGNVFLGVVHRLDRPVSGVLLFARTSKAAARLSEQFREGAQQRRERLLGECRRRLDELGVKWRLANCGGA